MNGRNHPSFRDPVTLLIGVGNYGRRDDGLGWAFLDRLLADGRYAGDVEYRYQLQVEDAERIRRERGVVFVDASVEPLPGGFQWRRCVPSGSHEFTSHALAPGTVLGLCHQLFGRAPPSQLLLIEGREWGLGAGLSSVASQNLASALRSFGNELSPSESSAAWAPTGQRLAPHEK